MKLHVLHDAPEAWLGSALERFERQFIYPLGAHDSFTISHGARYLPFFQAMGEATVLVAEEAGEVLGTIAFIKRRIEQAGERRTAHYLCDLKVAPAARGSRVLARLFAEVKARIEQGDSHACYCVVMNGTGRLPTSYTGRVGIPGFQKLADILVMRLPASLGVEVREGEGGLIHREGYVATGGDSMLRSKMTPVRLRGALASGTVEDTRLGKKLIAVSRDELLSAHLSGFAYATPEAGADLVRQAVGVAVKQGLPALFVAVPSEEAEKLRPLLGGEVLEAPATVYGYDLQPGVDWWVDTAEI